MADSDTVARLILAIENGQNALLHACGGAGKTYTLRELAKYLSRQGKIVACTATTGIAAINLSIPEYEIAGTTLHSWAGIGLGDGPVQRLEAKVRNDGRARKRWVETDVLMVDEISMMGARLLDVLDYIGRSIRRKNAPFGGLQFIFSGDFLQLPPVKDKWAFQSAVWSQVDITPFILEEPKRYPDLKWFELLLRIRKGEHTPKDIALLHTREEAYDKWLKASKTDSIITVKPTILYSKRVDVDIQNDQELDKLKDVTHSFLAEDTFTPMKPHARAEHYITPLDDVIPRAIALKVGAQVMLKANLDVAHGLVNGSRGVVVEFVSDGVKVKWFRGMTTLVTKHAWNREDKDGKASRSQIPLILAWALTIHKCQGCTLDYAICDLGPSIFCPGQAYVALSRVRSIEGLLLSGFYPESIRADPDALEYVSQLDQAQAQDSNEQRDINEDLDEQGDDDSENQIEQGDDDSGDQIEQECMGNDGRYSDPRGPHIKLAWTIVLKD